MKNTRWANYSIAYHIVWCPKYRKKIFDAETGDETKRLVEECCLSAEMELLAAEVDKDHVHVFVSAPPRMSPSTIVGLLKGYTSRFLRERFSELTGKNKSTKNKNTSLWTKTYYVGTAGSVSKEAILRYINECQGR